MTGKEITREELLNWHDKKEILIINDEETKKSLFFTMRLMYKVYHRKKLILETLRLEDAIKKYNSIK